MSIQYINVGFTENDGTGDSLRNAFIKVNSNLIELETMINDNVSQEELDLVLSGLTLSINDIYAILATKSDIGHTHIISEIIGLETALNGLTPLSNFNYAVSNINSIIANINNHISANTLSINNINESLDLKEDVANKTEVIGTGNTTNYPSTKSVVDYVTDVEDNLVGYINSGLAMKQDTLTAINIGEFMDNELSTKLTPMAGDSILARDILTNEGIEIPFSSFTSGLDNKISKSTGTTYTTNAILTVTQAEYDEIVTKDQSTLYFII